MVASAAFLICQYTNRTRQIAVSKGTFNDKKIIQDSGQPINFIIFHEINQISEIETVV